MNIADLLSENESARLEFKERFPSNEKLASLFCAFANTAGGDLVIGIEDGTRRVLGVSESDVLEMEEKIAAIASSCVSPIIFPLVKAHRCGPHRFRPGRENLLSGDCFQGIRCQRVVPSVVRTERWSCAMRDL